MERTKKKAKRLGGNEELYKNEVESECNELDYDYDI